MRFLKFKYIIAYIIIIAIGIVALVYYTGGLKFSPLGKDARSFDDSGFIDFSTLDEEGKPIVRTYNKAKIIAETATHALIFDEETTIGTVVDKRTCTSPGDYSTCEVTYQTAKNDTTSASGANLILYHAARSNGKVSPEPFNSMTHSVKFRNTLTNQVESHYKLKYVDNGVQILYDIGRFSANDDYFPKKFNVAEYNKKYLVDYEMSEDELVALEFFNRNSFEERFRGNIQFGARYVDHGDYMVLEYTGRASVYSYDALLYIIEHELAYVVTDIEDGLFGGSWVIEDIDPSFYDSYGTHLNSNTSPCTTNPFFSTQMYNSLYQYHYKKQTDSQDKTIQYWDVNLSSSQEKTKCYEFLYTSLQQIDLSTGKPIEDEDGNPVMRGGFHERDGEGNFLYNEDGSPKQALYSLEQVAYDNEIVGEEAVATSLQRFQVCLELVLTDTGLKATVLAESLRDSNHKDLDPIYKHDSLMIYLQFLREMTTSYDKEGEGLMVIPDGSGAIIEFNNGKTELNYAGYSKLVYGDDKSSVQDRAYEEVEKLMFPMNGFIDLSAGKGIMTVVEQGASLSTLSATTSERNIAYFTTNVRENEFVTAGTGWNAVKFPKWSASLAPNDIVYNFYFLEKDELSYVGLANRYRAYLIDKYDLTLKDTSSENLNIINLLGAFERYEMFLGIKYMKADSLTTFSQAEEIISELLANNVSNLGISYSHWTNKEMEYETTAKLKASKTLGGKTGLMDLSKYLAENNILFYPELYVATSKGFDYPFGSVKYTTRSVGNMQAIQYPFNLATLYINKNLAPTYYLKPAYYESIATNLYNSYQSFGIKGAFISDLGNVKIGDYARSGEIFSSDGMRYQINTMDFLQEQLGSLLLSAPFDYAFPYVNVAIDVPVKASAYGIFDQTIPFYQLVISGLFDYTTEAVNGTSDKSMDYFYTKALETGSNLYYNISYEDPSILLQTDYTQYYKTYYQNWKDRIIELNNLINASGIHGGRLINHERIAKGVSKVSYSNGVVLIVNTNNIAYQYGAITIDKYDYISVGG